MARREITTGFEIENGIITSGKVKVLVTVSQGKGPDKVEFCKDMEHTLDYTGCSVNDLIDSAAANDVVSLQNGVWRGLGSAVKTEAGKSTSMKDYYARERTRTAPDPAKAVLNAATSGKMSAEEINNLVRELQKRMGAA